MAGVESLSLSYEAQTRRFGAPICRYEPSPQRRGGGEAMSANASITDEMIVDMTSIKRWTGVLHWVGYPAEAAKNDWNAAYKHMGVIEEDHVLQVIEWGTYTLLNLN